LFLKHIFSLLLQQKICEQTHISNQFYAHFKRIRIMDATVFQVPKNLSKIFLIKSPHLPISNFVYYFQA
ncbi:hypothetical protein ACUOFC_68835, partial [Escherichia sp. TWPC-MK]